MMKLQQHVVIFTADDRACPAVDDFRCRTTGSCVRKYQVCDGKTHCSDGSDEKNCCM